MLTEAVTQGFSVKKVFLEIFAKCTGKHPCQSLFNKVAGLSVHKYSFYKINTYCINVNNFPHMIFSYRVQDKMCGFDMSARHITFFMWQCTMSNSYFDPFQQIDLESQEMILLEMLQKLYCWVTISRSENRL